MGELTSTVVRRLRNKDRPNTLNSVTESRAILNRVASEILRRIPNSVFFRDINARLTAIESMLSQTHPSRASQNAAVTQYVRRTPLFRTMKAKQLKQLKELKELKDKSEKSSGNGSSITDEDDSSSGGGGMRKLNKSKKSKKSKKSRKHKR
jgi:hypothetical protein